MSRNRKGVVPKAEQVGFPLIGMELEEGWRVVRLPTGRCGGREVESKYSYGRNDQLNHSEI